MLCGSARCVVAVVPFGALDGGGPDGAPPLVALVDEWLEVASADGGEVVVGVAPADTVDGSTATELARRLDGSRSALAELEVVALDQQLTAEAELVDASARAVDLESELALDELGSVLERHAIRRVGAVGHDELLAVCQVVGRSIGITVHPAHPEDLLRSSPVEAIALASKVRARPVRLPEAWWKELGGSFVGYHTDGRPVAVLARRRGYDIVDPVS